METWNLKFCLKVKRQKTPNIKMGVVERIELKREKKSYERGA